MKRVKKHLIKPAGTHPKKTKIGMPPGSQLDMVFVLVQHLEPPPQKSST